MLYFDMYDKFCNDIYNCLYPPRLLSGRDRAGSRPSQSVITIKHTNGDYFRTYPFNKTLTLSKHKQIVEVQCQREYEGKHQ